MELSSRVSLTGRKRVRLLIERMGGWVGLAVGEKVGSVSSWRVGVLYAGLMEGSHGGGGGGRGSCTTVHANHSSSSRTSAAASGAPAWRSSRTHPRRAAAAVVMSRHGGRSLPQSS